MIPKGIPYETFYLNSFSRLGDDLLILKINPRHLYHEWDVYSHEIHITSSALDQTGLFGSYGFPRYINDSVPIFLCEEIETNGGLSVFEGEFYEESEVSFWLPYRTIEFKKVEKLLSNE